MPTTDFFHHSDPSGFSLLSRLDTAARDTVSGHSVVLEEYPAIVGHAGVRRAAMTDTADQYCCLQAV